MKFRPWLVILLEIANMSLGQKNLKSCEMNVFEQSLSSPLAFPILVNIKPYKKYSKITQNAVFNFFWAKFGELPFLQECPYCTISLYLFTWLCHSSSESDGLVWLLEDLIGIFLRIWTGITQFRARLIYSACTYIVHLVNIT